MSLSVQWGNAGNSGGSVDVTFPISFTKTVYQIQLTYNSSSYENPTYAIKDTRSFSYWSKYGGDKLWFALGIQQWGVVTDDRSTLTFLLPFSNSDYFYAAFPTNKVNTGGINLHGVRNPTYLELYSSISNNSNTANNWQFSGRNINPCWLAVGIQQWGVSVTSNTGPVTITYPIAHTIFACPYTTSTMNSDAVAAINTDNNTVQSFDVHARWGSGYEAAWAADTFNWFSVGI